MKPIDLQNHIYSTYFSLRIGLAVLAFAFPLLLVGIGYFMRGIPPQGSMSAYYFAFEPITSEMREFPMRGLFVGILFALGSFLFLYKGFSRTENIALNVAGLSALAVALIHMKAPDYCKNCGSDAFSFLHGVAAVILFVCMAFVTWACTEQTLGQLKKPKQDWFRRCYSILAILMIIAPAAAVALTYVLQLDHWLVLIVEGLGVWTFASYWSLKSYELSISDAERKALMGQMPATDTTSPKEYSLRKRASRLLD